MLTLHTFVGVKPVPDWLASAGVFATEVITVLVTDAIWAPAWPLVDDGPTTMVPDFFDFDVEAEDDLLGCFLVCPLLLFAAEPSDLLPLELFAEGFIV